jgi:VWFA-related protein
MPALINAIKTGLVRILCSSIILSLALPLSAQTPEKPVQDQGEVIRVFTDLVQTDVMVFDKQGKFVNGLKREDFALKIDGKEKPIDFFERVSAGSDEEAQLAAARGGSNLRTPKGPVPLDRGRIVFFYVDDFHMDLQGVVATKKVVNRYIDEEMGQNDEAAVTSASGVIGFLQQVTDNKVVLRAALDKIVSRPYNVRDVERPPMTEYQSLQISNNDIETTNFFVDETIRNNPGMTRDQALNIVQTRARILLQQAGHITTGTLAGLETLIRRANKLSGRKLVFFISDGFFIDHNSIISDSKDRLRRITSAAARSGVVIYSMDARGLATGLPDASSDQAFDPGGRLFRSNMGELSASQDGMFSLANDTGGRAIFNTNDFRPGLIGALKETSFYYLLAWKPEHQGQSDENRFRKIEVTIPKRSDLVVRVRRGFFDVEPQPIASKEKEKKDKKEPEKEKKDNGLSPIDKQLQDALNAAYPVRVLPVSLALTFLHTPDKGARLSASMEVPGEFLTFSPEGGESKAALDILGSFFNEKGQRGQSFKGTINVTASQDEVTKGFKRGLSYTYPVDVEPGLYQVRVAARDAKSGLTGSAVQWVEIPDLTKGKLSLSSLLLGERAESTLEPVSSSAQNADSVGLSISRRFSSHSYLRFLVFVYNALRTTTDGNPDVAIQVQVVRDNQPVVTTPLKKIATEGIADVARLPYAAEIPLHGLPSGYYVLKVTVIDRASKNSSSQQARFEVY